LAASFGPFGIIDDVFPVEGIVERSQGHTTVHSMQAFDRAGV